MGEWQAAARAQRKDLDAQVRDLEGVRQRHAGSRKQLEEERARVLHDFGKAVLPSLDPAAIDAAVKLTGFVALKNDDPIGQREAERKKLAARVAEIEADPGYANRELLRAPRVGQLTRQVDELEEFRAPLAETVARAQHERLTRLLDTGYGTPAYKVGFWRLSYYRDWRAADEIAERFPGKTFAEVRADWVQASDTIKVYDQKLAELRADIAAGEALEREHDGLAAALASLDQQHLQMWWQRLGEHVMLLDPAALGDRLKDSADLELLLKQASGINKKIEYLDQIVASQVEPLAQELRAEAQKLDADMAKNASPKKAGQTFDDAAFQKRFRDRPLKYRRRYEGAVSSYQTVYVFDRYDRASFVDDFLWWNLMTGGRIDGGFIPEVSSWRDQHPGYRFGRDPDDAAMSVAAAAVATHDLSQGPTTVDPS